MQYDYVINKPNNYITKPQIRNTTQLIKQIRKYSYYITRSLSHTSSGVQSLLSKIVASSSSLSFFLWPKPRFVGQLRWAGSDSVNIYKYWFHIGLVNRSDRQSIRQHLDNSVWPMIWK